MTANEYDKPARAWSQATFTGAIRESMRRWAQLPLERMLAAQEEMAGLALALAGAADGTVRGGTQAPARYAVIGHPAGHSQSPWIHARFAEATGQQLTYEIIDAPPEAFERTVRDFLAAGGHGMNVTLPHKEAAFRMADHLGAAAREAGAVNFLRREPDGSLYGDNTDGSGLVRDLTDNLGLLLTGRRVLLLGAGGAARGVLGPLLAERPARLHVVNRTPERARELVEAFGNPPAVAADGPDSLRGEAVFDLVLNATAAGLEGQVLEVPRHCIGPATFCYDLFYGPGETPFMTWAWAAGAGGVAQGAGMLVEQAADSFLLWRGVRPQTGEVLAELQQRLQSG